MIHTGLSFSTVHKAHSHAARGSSGVIAIVTEEKEKEKLLWAASLPKQKTTVSIINENKRERDENDAQSG